MATRCVYVCVCDCYFVVIDSVGGRDKERQSDSRENVVVDIIKRFDL